MSATELWGVNILGPDDMIAAANYEAAVDQASAFNDWWQRTYLGKLTPNDPRMWAVPTLWLYGEKSHESDLANANSEYRWLRTATASRKRNERIERIRNIAVMIAAAGFVVSTVGALLGWWP